jgi:hypothetical protein
VFCPQTEHTLHIVLSDGDPYIARFPDANGNVAQRSVPRPDVISQYFSDSNVIDSHNQARQGVLQLEKHWVVQDCWFRSNTTLIGMTVTDCWRAYKHALTKDVTIKDFADQMAYDCIYNAHSDTASTTNAFLATAADDLPRTVGGRQSDVSSITAPSLAVTAASIMAAHAWKSNPELEYPRDAAPRPIRRVCLEAGCNKKTPKCCSNRACENYTYPSPRGLMRGVFYCSDHQYKHIERQLNGTGV